MNPVPLAEMLTRRFLAIAQGGKMTRRYLFIYLFIYLFDYALLTLDACSRVVS